ncbi:MAG TPA: tetratricopeptide repeat protein [Thermoanaerobaculia bacterium]|nr:tetratricopeptide repeat protein [Thermoanaerobaculia bacterium]
MDEHLRDLVVEFNRWFGDRTAPDTVTSRLLELPPRRWRQFFETFESEERVRIARVLTERAYSIQERSPKEAIPVAYLAVMFAKAIEGETDRERAKALELEADAWREHARSLLLVGDLDAARRSADEAAFNYSISINEGELVDAPLVGDVLGHFLDTRSPIPDDKREVLEKATRLALVLGQILHGQGRTDHGLAMMARACEILLYCFDDRELYVKGRITYAKVLAEAKRFTEALDVFQQTAALANELQDPAVQAHLVNNIGVCYYYLGNFQKAKTCAETAMAIFESLEMPIDAIRPRTLLVLLLMEQAKGNKTLYSAAAELFKTRAAWLSAGMKRDAAQVMVDIILAFILAGRQGHINWAEMNRTFTEAGLGDAALRALQHLEATHAMRPLTADDVEDAHRTIFNLDPTGAEMAGVG